MKKSDINQRPVESGFHKTEDRRPVTEDRRQKTGDGSKSPWLGLGLKKTEDGRPKTEDQSKSPLGA